MTPLDVAREYAQRGWATVPIPTRSKACLLNNWPQLRITPETAAEHFNSEPKNVGVLLGAPSGGLLDVDLDSPEACALAPHLLPETGAVFGRESNPNSHCLYIAADTAPATTKFEDKELGTIAELRSTGAQTVFPGSIHVSGEPITWEAQGAPARVNGVALRTAVARLAAAALITHHWADGVHNDLNVRLAGTLLRSGWDAERIQELVSAICEAAGDTKTAERLKRIAALADDYVHRRDTKRIPGQRLLAESIGEEHKNLFCRWIGIGEQEPAELLPAPLAAIPDEWLDVAPPALEYVVEPWLPRATSALLVSEGGSGKTTLAMRIAVAVAGGRPLLGLKVRQGKVAYFTLEDNKASVRRRLYQIYTNEVRRMREEGLPAEAIDTFRRAVLTNLRVCPLVGFQFHLVTIMERQLAQSALVSAVIDALDLGTELVVLDPMSRTHGNEENDNVVGTALIIVAERISLAAGCCTLYTHHTGKAASRNKDETMYSARGASGMADAARTVLRLMVADHKDAEGFKNIDPDVVARGDLVRVHHAKLNDGPRAADVWLRRQGFDFEVFAPELGTVDTNRTAQIAALHDWWCRNKRNPFTKEDFKNSAFRTEAFQPLKVVKESVAPLINWALRQEPPILIEVGGKTSGKLLAFRADYEPEPL
jgi:RecA-family ATPase